MPALQEQGFTKAELDLHYLLFPSHMDSVNSFMGTVSDRSNARIFLVLGLALTAIVNLLMDLYRFSHQV